ncbi:hypothetical protein FLP41_10290 [Paracoccus marcusii]|uniref:hypothetical protein n=1 Tax=Paracoccus marcusii TaxID=59779 RepID=UPI002ED6B5C4|nr:hypothetical protein FLP41_10290 [Paracoccus marcusii]
MFAGHAFGQRVILVRVAEAVQDHVRAGARQPVGHAQPDARVGSGDNGGLALEEFLEHRLLLDGPERRFAGAAWAKTPAQGGRSYEAGFIQARNLSSSALFIREEPRESNSDLATLVDAPVKPVDNAAKQETTGRQAMRIFENLNKSAITGAALVC